MRKCCLNFNVAVCIYYNWRLHVTLWTSRCHKFKWASSLKIRIKEKMRKKLLLGSLLLPSRQQAPKTQSICQILIDLCEIKIWKKNFSPLQVMTIARVFIVFLIPYPFHSNSQLIIDKSGEMVKFVETLSMYTVVNCCRISKQ